MSILLYDKKSNSTKSLEVQIPYDRKDTSQVLSPWKPTDEEKKARSLVMEHFQLGYQNMYTPRVEFNDAAVIQRMQIDQMNFNSYQPNNGEPATEDQLGAWRSNAIRPVVRNKVISIAAHVTARLMFPKVHAVDDDNEEHKEAAQVMEGLMEWSAMESDYAYFSLQRVIAALTDPVSIGYQEYTENYRTVKMPNEDGTFTEKQILDTEFSGYKNQPVPCDEFFIENFYESNVQKQGFVIWRKVISYANAYAKYKNNPNFKYVHPGIQVLYSDPNQSFYQVYDSQMRKDDVEEIIYFNRSLDLKLVLCNGVLITAPDNPNPRIDKQYPFDTFGYELINNRCFYFKSLAFKLAPDSDVVNTMYRMIADKSYLTVFPPMVAVGSDEITGDVIVPGAVTTFTEPNSDMRAMQLGQPMTDAFKAMDMVNDSIAESTREPLDQQNTDMTAYEASRIEANANTVLGLFIRMIGKFVRDFGHLRLSDILQYATIPQVDEIDGDELTYKTFIVPDTNGHAKKFIFETMDPMTDKEKLYASIDLWMEGKKKDITIYKVNPILFRDLCYKVYVTDEVLSPKTEEFIRAMRLELFDRAIQLGPAIDQERLVSDMLLGAYPTIVKNPDEYKPKTPPTQPQGQPIQAPQPTQLQPGTPSPQGAQPQSNIPRGSKARFNGVQTGV